MPDVRTDRMMRLLMEDMRERAIEMGDGTETRYERRKRRQREEQEALDTALSNWITDESGHNARQLYLAGCAYLGIKPDEHKLLKTEE